MASSEGLKKFNHHLKIVVDPCLLTADRYYRVWIEASS